MANAIKKISVQQGYDVTEYALQCFGSAGGQHACLIADTLGMETVLLHPLSGLLSAYGMGLANIRASREESQIAIDGATLARIGTLSGTDGSCRGAGRRPGWQRPRLPPPPRPRPLRRHRQRVAGCPR
jgi:5-oxoprolinase (ATP-hydrolysing)